jgi:pimeloyl-ACP methyl ester carboxylesterase
MAADLMGADLMGADPMKTLTVADGTRLHLIERGDPDAPLTVILVHGWTLDSRTWQHQLAYLATAVGEPVRVLAFDHRGHGRSGPVRIEDATVARAAEDLAEVIARAAPTGRLVLAGHSLGGMTIMALAETRPELLERVAAVALVATSAGGLAGLTPIRSSRAAARWAAARWSRLEAALNRRLLARGERPGRLPAALVRPGVRWLTFGRPAARAEVRVAARMIAGCSPYTMAAFRPSLDEHDRAAVLPSLTGRPVLVLGGSHDRLTPLPHSQLLAEGIPGAELVVYDGAGHMLPLERGPDLTRRLATLVRGVHPAHHRAVPVSDS